MTTTTTRAAAQPPAPRPEQQLGEVKPVGYFCDHSDEPLGARTHQDWEWDEENGGHTFQHQPNTISAHSSVDRGYLRPEQAERRCPRAVPVYAVDAPALLAEIDRLRDRVAELETFAYGCDAEGCVIPHSSWCEAAKKAAADNDGCTCGKPWGGQPQPHAMHCWTVNPPRNEVEEMRKRIAGLLADAARLTAENDALLASLAVPGEGDQA